MKDKLSKKKRRYRASLNKDYLKEVLKFWCVCPMKKPLQWSIWLH
jgi:hypothetical protein